MKIKFGQVVPAFLAGILIGGALMLSPMRRQIVPRWPDNNPPHKRMLHAMNKRLNLDRAQMNSIATIFEQKREKIDAIMAESRPKLAEIRNETRQEIRKLLKPEQIEKFEEMDAQMEARFRRFGERSARKP